MVTRSRASSAQATASAPTVTTARVREALLALQAAARDALATVSALSGSRPVDVVAALGLDLKLAWKLARIAQSGDPFAAVRHLPGIAGWRIATGAMRAAGADAALVARADEAFEEVVRIGTAWAGDRRAFDMMAAGLASGSDLRIDVEHRRQLYLGGSYVWGVRARLALRVDVLGPAARRGTIDCATMRGFVDLERLRADAGWQFEVPVVIDDRGTRPQRCRCEPIEPAGDGAGPPAFLMRSFCSSPLPTLRPAAARGPGAFELAASDVGVDGRMTLVQGSILRSVQPVKRSKRHHGIFQLFRQRTPAERTVFDLVVHESLLEESPKPEAILYGDLHLPAGAYLHKPTDRIPAGIDVEPLGAASRRLKLEGFDGYAGLVGAAFAATGWNPAEFRVFRTSAPYLPVPSTLALELPIAD